MALIVVLAGGYAIVKATESTPSAAILGMRALVVPTNDAARTVVVAPCGTGAHVLSTNTTSLLQTTGVTDLQLPKGQGDRIVLVPACSGGRGAAALSSNIPSSAFVLTPGSPVPPIGANKQTTTAPEAGVTSSAQLELTVPAGSPIRTVVMSPCENPTSSIPAQQVLGPTGSSSTAVAPTC